jgi:hypothetical protein
VTLGGDVIAGSVLRLASLGRRLAAIRGGLSSPRWTLNAAAADRSSSSPSRLLTLTWLSGGLTALLGRLLTTLLGRLLTTLLGRLLTTLLGRLLTALLGRLLTTFVRTTFVRTTFLRTTFV